MMDCLIIGDSIAVGLSNLRKDCISFSKGGITSRGWSINHINRPSLNMIDYNTAVISLGTNDGVHIETYEFLTEIRSVISAKTVYWIMPAVNPRSQEIVFKVARQRGDRIVYIKDLSSDGVHPSTNGYKWLAYQTQMGE
jgi:lysophospholipase L1-like esterase